MIAPDSMMRRSPSQSTGALPSGCTAWSEGGADAQTASFNETHQSTMVENLEEYRQEVSGVSLDEEMVNLIQFQQAYNAAAKLITTADEMLDALLEMVK